MSPPFPGQDIHPGAASDDVAVWQARMRERGWRIDITGVHDEQSVAVCRQFQLEKDLGGAGVIDRDSWEGAFDLPVTPRPGKELRLTVTLHADRKSDDEVEYLATVRNIGRTPTPAGRVTCMLRVFNPEAWGTNEYEIDRMEMPVPALAPGQQEYLLFYTGPPLRRDQFLARVDIFDSTTTYATADVWFR